MIAPYYADDAVTLHHGDAVDVLRSLPDASVDAVCTDPPYELGFMGRAWDASGIAYSVDLWREALRVLKPGGYLLAFGGTRTWHRLVCAVEDAGFEIRDGMAWMYGSGFPKSLDVSKAIDKAAGAEREVTGERVYADGTVGHWTPAETYSQHEWSKTPRGKFDTAPATDDARRWQGWGTALKPAFEPIVVARKPLIGTVAANVTAHGTGALNIDGCRVESGERPVMVRTATVVAASSMSGQSTGATPSGETTTQGRWPTNVVLSHAPLLDDCGEVIGDACADGCVPGCPVADLDAQSGVTASKRSSRGVGWNGSAVYGAGDLSYDTVRGHGDAGGASRFFPTFRYEAKAPTAERPRAADGTAHPTVKPLDFMRWLVRLVTPPGGVVLEPFAGSGTTAEACVLEGFRCIAVEREAAYLPLITARLTKPLQPALDFGDAA